MKLDSELSNYKVINICIKFTCRGTFNLGVHLKNLFIFTYLFFLNNNENYKKNIHYIITMVRYYLMIPQEVKP